VASISTPTVFAQEDSGIDIISTAGTALVEIGTLAPTLLSKTFVGLRGILADILENGFNFDEFASALAELAINIGSEIASVFINVGFTALGPQLSVLIQDALAVVDPFDVSSLFDGDWKELDIDDDNGEDNGEDNCDKKEYQYKIDESKIKDFSTVSITTLKINSQNIDDGKIFLDLEAAVGNFGISFDFNGTVKQVGCDKEDETSFTAAYKKLNVGLDLKVKIDAFVEGSMFNLTSADFSEIAFNSDDETMEVELAEIRPGNNLPEEVKDELIEKMLLEVNVYVDVIQESVDDISVINTEIVELGLLPFSVELPFEWPF